MSADHKARGGMADIDAALAEFERWTTGLDSRSAPEYRHSVLRQDGDAFDVIHYRRTREDAEQACRACAMAAALQVAAEVRAGQEHGGDVTEMVGEVERLRALLAQPERQLMGFHERHAVLHARALAAEAWRAKATEVLRDLEWSDVVATEESYTDGCPGCGAWKENGHEPDCRLATLLSDHPAPEPGVEAGASAETAELERGLARELLIRFRDPENFIAPHFDNVEQATILTALERMATPANGGRDAS